MSCVSMTGTQNAVTATQSRILKKKTQGGNIVQWALDHPTPPDVLAQISDFCYVIQISSHLGHSLIHHHISQLGQERLNKT